uniref:Uncharacterized protein n=1 Tax=Anguilla anguilla TaxID=7936 RepID=A0A0E9PMW0_ANGAN
MFTYNISVGVGYELFYKSPLVGLLGHGANKPNQIHQDPKHSLFKLMTTC